jgi:pyruvate/2-oxoglutarate dehydrogenase complex dihydrolipoamide acyltransferase (E2) component
MGRVEVRIPQLSMGMSEAEVVQWLVAVGDRVAVDTDLVEIEAEKATVAIPSPAAGLVAEIAAQPGDVLDVRALLCVIEEAG